MIDLLSYAFFRNALAATLLISIVGGMLGCYIVTRRLVSISGGITHACFGGLGLGYFLGLPPIWLASVFAVLSALSVQWLGREGRVREDSAIAVVWALGMAVGVTFVFLTPGAVPELNSFLFGNILTVTLRSLSHLLLFAVLLALFLCVFYGRITACAFDPDFARVAGIRVWLYNGVMLLFIALGIVLMIRCVGMMLLMSMLTLPAMCAELFTHRLAPMMLASVVISIVGCTAGLFASAVINIPASAMIVAFQVGLYALFRTAKWLTSRI